MTFPFSRTMTLAVNASGSWHGLGHAMHDRRSGEIPIEKVNDASRRLPRHSEELFDDHAGGFPLQHEGGS